MKCGFPGKVMADSETQKLERKDFFQRIVETVGVCMSRPAVARGTGGGRALDGPFRET